MTVVIEAEGLTRVFSGPVPVHALRRADLRMERGEMVAIIGRSGSGKSTLLNLIGLLDRPSEGRLSIDGHDCSSLSDTERTKVRRSTMGFVFQRFHLIERRSAAANIDVALAHRRVGRGERRNLIEHVADQVGISHLLNTPVTRLSGGERQRVAIARAVVTPVSVLFADEPTGNLDADTEAQVFEVLRGMTRGGTAVVMVTHNRDLAVRCDRIISIHDGVTTEATP